MPVPSQPKNLLPRPFAADGTFQLIPDTPNVSGRASFQSGFPQETQLPLSQGGVAPNRTDFNGLFYMLSAFSFWQQSGGMFSYKATLNYTVPNLVFHQGELWWCTASNGPDYPAGVKEPGTTGSEDYWLDFLQKLAGGNSGSLFGNPVGTVITYYGTSAPEGYFACDGSTFSVTANPKLHKVLGSALLPDLRGYFIRGYDTRNVVDPDAPKRVPGSVQGDAIRNMTGRVLGSVEESQSLADGVFKILPIVTDGANNGKGSFGFDFDASRQVPTALENRPKNVCLLYCIKHD